MIFPYVSILTALFVCSFVYLFFGTLRAGILPWTVNLLVHGRYTHMLAFSKEVRADEPAVQTYLSDRTWLCLPRLAFATRFDWDSTYDMYKIYISDMRIRVVLEPLIDS